MRFRSIEQLDNTNSYFNLEQTVWTIVKNRTYFMYVVDSFNNMRLDQICYDIYGSNEYMDFLMFINDIINPLNVKDGDILIYTNQEDINNFKVDPEVVDNIKNKLINLSKTTRTDKGKSNYNEKVTSLPPTVNQNPTPVITLDGTQVIIGKGIFNV